MQAVVVEVVCMVVMQIHQCVLATPTKEEIYIFI